MDFLYKLSEGALKGVASPERRSEFNGILYYNLHSNIINTILERDRLYETTFL